MNDIAICTDSSSLLFPAAAIELGVEVVEIEVTLDGTPFEGEADAFYASLRGGAVATTSQPSPASFLATYERAAARGATRVLSLHLDRRASGVVTSAALAAREASIPVEVAELPTASFGVGICVRTAAREVAAGASLAQARMSATRTAEALDNVFVARSAPSGRVSAPDAEWALLRFADGVTAVVASHVSTGAANAAMTQVIGTGGECVVAVGHAGLEVEAAADALAHALLREERVRGVERYRVTPSVGAHTGPDSYGAFWWPLD